MTEKSKITENFKNCIKSLCRWYSIIVRRMTEVSAKIWKISRCFHWHFLQIKYL